MNPTISMVVVAVASLLVGGLTGAARAQDDPTPNTVDFVIADSDVIYPTGNPPNDPGDVVVITGRPLGTTDAGSCGPVRGDQYPLHNVVVIDPGYGNRSTRFTNVIVVASANPVKAGTKLAAIHAITACDASGIGYVKYRGTVQ